MTTLIVLSIPFLLIAGFCFAMSQYAGGWDGLGWAVYMAVALGVWALVVAGCFVWLIVRDGPLVWHGVPLLILVLAVLAGATWGARLWWQDHTCKAEGTFYEAFAAQPMSQRPAMLALAPRPLDDLTFCGRETVALRFLADPYAPLPAASQEEADRIATLALLLEHGLPPDDTWLYQAVAAADPEAVRLLIARRMASGGGEETVPARFVEQALGGIDNDPMSPYHAFLGRYLEILRIFIDAGFDPCLPLNAASTFRDEMERKGVPEDLLGKAC